MTKPSRSQVVVGALVGAPLLVFVAVPLALLLVRSVANGPEAYRAALADPASRRALVNTFLSGGGAALLSFAIGAPLGAALARLRIGGGRVLDALLILPIAVPPYVWAFAWIALGAPRVGWLNQLAGTAWLDVFGLPGMIWVLGLSMYPLVLLPTRAALESADPALEEAARIAGAGPFRAFLVGAVPVALPAAVGGTLLAFLGAISAFGVPYLHGVATERPVLVATTRIYQAMALGSEHDVQAAIALCVVLLAIAALATWAASRAARPQPLAMGKGRRAALLDAPGLARAATIGGWTFAAIGVVLPAIAIVLSALTKKFGDPPGPGNLTVSQFSTVLASQETRRALLHSGWLALASATAIVVLGVGIAFLRPRERGAGGKMHPSAAFARLAEAPYAIPGSVLALALLLAFSQEIRLVLFDRVTIAFQAMGTLWILGIAYVVKYLAFGVRAAETALRSADPALEEAARISGAGAARAFWDVGLPIARPALTAAWILAFLPVATELTMSVLLAGPRTPVLGTVLFELSSYADPPAAAVLACVCLALVAAAQLGLARLDHKGAQ